MDEDFDISGDDEDVSFHDVEPLDNPDEPVDQPVVSTESIIQLKRTRGRPLKTFCMFLCDLMCYKIFFGKNLIKFIFYIFCVYLIFSWVPLTEPCVVITHTHILRINAIYLI